MRVEAGRREKSRHNRKRGRRNRKRPDFSGKLAPRKGRIADDRNSRDYVTIVRSWKTAQSLPPLPADRYIQRRAAGCGLN